MTNEAWLLVGASILTVELFLRTDTLSKCLVLVIVMQRAQNAIMRRKVTQYHKERAVMALWILTMKHTAALTLNILTVFTPLALLWLVDLCSNMRVFALLDWGPQHLMLIFATVAYALARRRCGR